MAKALFVLEKENPFAQVNWAVSLRDGVDIPEIGTIRFRRWGSTEGVPQGQSELQVKGKRSNSN